MNHHWFIFKDPQTIITNEFNKYHNKNWAKTKLVHNQNGKNDKLKELRVPTLTPGSTLPNCLW